MESASSTSKPRAKHVVFGGLALGAVIFAAGYFTGRATTPTPPATPHAAPSVGSSSSQSVSASSSVVFGSAAPATSAAIGSATEPASPPSSGTTTIQRAKNGDLSALKILDQAAPNTRTLDESIALALGHAELVKQEASALIETLKANPKLLDDKSTLIHVYRLLLDEAVAISFARDLSVLDAGVIADLLDDLGRRADSGSRLGILMRDLVASKDFAPPISPALRVLLDLSSAKECWQIANLLPAVTRDGDERVAAELARKACFPDGDEKKALDAAIAAANERKWRPLWRRPG